MSNLPISVEAVRGVEYEYKGYLIRVENRSDRWYWSIFDLDTTWRFDRGVVQAEGSILTGMGRAEWAIENNEV